MKNLIPLNCYTVYLIAIESGIYNQNGFGYISLIEFKHTVINAINTIYRIGHIFQGIQIWRMTGKIAFLIGYIFHDILMCRCDHVRGLDSIHGSKFHK